MLPSGRAAQSTLEGQVHGNKSLLFLMSFFPPLLLDKHKGNQREERNGEDEREDGAESKAWGVTDLLIHCK